MRIYFIFIFIVATSICVQAMEQAKAPFNYKKELEKVWRGDEPLGWVVSYNELESTSDQKSVVSYTDKESGVQVTESFPRSSSSALAISGEGIKNHLPFDIHISAWDEQGHYSGSYPSAIHKQRLAPSVLYNIAVAGRVAISTDAVCKWLYEEALTQGKFPPYSLASALHKGFVHSLFRFYAPVDSCPYKEEEIAKFLATVNCSTLNEAVFAVIPERLQMPKGEASYYANRIDPWLVDKIVKYCAVMKGTSPNQVVEYFPVQNNSECMLESEQHHALVNKLFNLPIKDEKFKAIVQKFVAYVGQSPTIANLEGIATWITLYDNASEINTRQVESFIKYVAMMSGIRFPVIARCIAQYDYGIKWSGEAKRLMNESVYK